MVRAMKPDRLHRYNGRTRRLRKLGQGVKHVSLLLGKTQFLPRFLFLNVKLLYPKDILFALLCLKKPVVQQRHPTHYPQILPDEPKNLTNRDSFQ